MRPLSGNKLYSTYIRSMPDRMMDKKGYAVLVNGVIDPVLKAKKSLLRLRLLNGSLMLEPII